MVPVVPRREASCSSLATADTSATCSGKVSPIAGEVALADALRQKGISEPVRVYEKVTGFSWGLTLESRRSDALPLANATLEVFGVGQDWARWKETALKGYELDQRLKGVVELCCH